MTLYEGRIKTQTNSLMDALNRSLPVDIRLLPYDIKTNRVWAEELESIGIYNREELIKVLGALGDIERLQGENAFDPLPDDEDVHTLVERLLTERLGELGARIHSGRSRNDQVICDTRMFVMDTLDTLRSKCASLVQVLATLGKKHSTTLLAGTTHFQPAQPISLGHFLLSCAHALMRDACRMKDARKRAALCPLGSGALAGSGFAIDRQRLALKLGFEQAAGNTLDATSDRDVEQETAACCAIAAGHLSRYAEQLIIWANPAFEYVRFSDAWSTGSSMMPQKRNPDAMELIRAKAARMSGPLNVLLSMTKGVPLAYAKDLQEDKTALFDATDTLALALDVFAEALGSASFDKAAMRARLTPDLLATDLADRLTLKGVPFRKSHERVAAFVTLLEKSGLDLMNAPSDMYIQYFPELENPSIGTFEQALKRRAVFGATSPKEVLASADALLDWSSQVG